MIIPSFSLLLITMIFKSSDAEDSITYIRERRKLNEPSHFDVPIYMDLQFVDNSLASEIETFDDNNPNVVHFCRTIQTQIFGTIVTQAARKYNSTFVNRNNGLLDCTIVSTTRVYDPEAEDVFGAGFFSFQVHVSQHIVVESSNQTLYMEVVQSIVEEGFDIVSGGQREFRSNLHTNPLFLSVISVKIRSGLTPPAEPPSHKPTVSPTKIPTKFPTQKPSMIPSFFPSLSPSGMPSNGPSEWPSLIPSESPSVEISNTPSFFPSYIPSINPSTSPSIIPSAIPSLSPSVIPSTSPSASLSIFFLQDNASSTTTQDSTKYNNGAVIAGIVGASVLFVSLCLFVILLRYQYRKKPRDRYPFPTEVALSQNIHNSFVPGIVELGDEQQSLADTTLGDQEAEGAWTQRKYNQPLRSFDENSLYTTPFEVDAQEYRASTITPISTVRTHSSLSMQLMTPLHYEDSVVFLASGSTTDESSEDADCSLSSERNKDSPTGTAGTASTTNTSIPVDVDSNEPYYDNLRITKIEPLDPRLSIVSENEDFTCNPSDLDVWSCDFEDFDRGSDFYRGETCSRSTSLSSSASTHQIKNVARSSLLSDNDNVESSMEYPKLSQNISYNREESTPTGISSKEVRCSERTKDENTLSTSSTVVQLKNGTKPNRLVVADRIKFSPSSPESSKASSSSKKSTISNLSRKAKTGTSEYRPQNKSYNGKDDSVRSDIVSPLTKLFESMSIPAATPEGNESEYIERTGSKSASPRREYLAAKENKSSGAATSDDDDSDMSASPWLMEEVEATLGPKGANADISSLSGKSSIRSHHSKSKRQLNGTKRNGSETSYGSSNSRFSNHDVSSLMSAVSTSMSTTDILFNQQPEEITFSTSRSTLEEGIKRLEMQLASLDREEEHDMNDDSTSSVTMSSITGASFCTSISARSRHTTGRNTQGKRVLVLVPPGKLGVILTDQHDGKGTIISSIKIGSPVAGVLKRGDKLIAIDDVRVEKLSCSQITSLIASRADRERRFTVITNSFNRSQHQQVTPAVF
mmetsp:Transcript_43526/g.49191  ORF Transcript_43526/g.49191 Transcript_43526/m.49191 type:complete len:1033 (+) Transcript_43526:397-3495(+)